MDAASYFLSEVFIMMISVGIDVSKDKHDCFIVSSEGEVLTDLFTISNNMDGFHCLLQRNPGLYQPLRIK